MAEHREWLAHKFDRSIFYASWPKAISATVVERVLSIAFSKKASQLKAPKALIYAMSLRIIIVSGMLLFYGIVIYSFTSRAP